MPATFKLASWGTVISVAVAAYSSSQIFEPSIYPVLLMNLQLALSSVLWGYTGT